MSTVDLLIAHAPSAPEHLRRRVLELRPVEHRRRVRPVLVLAVAAAIAVLAAVVHGFSTSSPRRNVLTLQGGVAKTRAVPTWTTADSVGSAGTGTLRAIAVPAPAPNRLTRRRCQRPELCCSSFASSDRTIATSRSSAGS